MMETWHPDGPVRHHHRLQLPGRRLAWNAALALVCGDPVLWKPSEKTPLCAIAVQKIMDRALKRFGDGA
jgi:aldehyde dehydrogenase (NAD+)